MHSSLLAAIVPIEAEPIFVKAIHSWGAESWLTNSILVSVVLLVTLVTWARRSTRRMEMIPGPAQNFFEFVVAGLYDFFEGIVGQHMIPKSFSLLASLFLYILAANWFGLLPGVGSIGWIEPNGSLLPLLRPATADMNTTIGLAIVFMIFWFVWTLQEVGPISFLKHIFGVKGGVKGVMAFFLMPIFFFVGIIEVISILIRPVSLSLRLFGNVFAGENLLNTMMSMGATLHFPLWLAHLTSVILPIPFYFLELLIGVLQAFVFALLCAVYLNLSTSHDEMEAEGH
ncbi:MAG: F0F1 ATP synthase subunit A [Chthoniobacterales bacterium]|nr:F0F1 ATP synthase subunit A [Chthoniobacterales bacterium]